MGTLTRAPPPFQIFWKKILTIMFTQLSGELSAFRPWSGSNPDMQVSWRQERVTGDRRGCAIWHVKYTVVILNATLMSSGSTPDVDNQGMISEFIANADAMPLFSPLISQTCMKTA
jgi:hypothetical protein